MNKKPINNRTLELTAEFNVKSVGEDEDIIVEGYGNTTTKDRGSDVVLEEAWLKGGLDNYLKNPILLAFHDHTRPIGKVEEYSVNNKGLKVVARISKAAGEVYDLVKSGVLRAFSIGFRVKDADYDHDTDIFVIKDLELYELSVVSVPMNADSLFSVRKSFDNDNEYNEFKDSFDKKLEEKSETKVEEDSSNNKGDTKVDKKETISLTPEELAAQEQKAVEAYIAKKEAEAAAEEKIKTVAVEAGKDQVEKLVEKAESKLNDKTLSLEEALEELRNELKDNKSELEALQKSKMTFQDNKRTSGLTDEEIDKAVLVAKITGKGVLETDFFKSLREKAGDHLTGTNADNYETIFSTRMYDQMQDKLIIEPLFNANRIAMTSRSMVFPFNPEAGHANWVADTAYKSTDGTSSGTERTHAVQDITMKAEKLATKEAVGYEEEEDAIIPILPIVQAAVARRMARTTDMELLRADSGVETVAATTGQALINGVATLATDVAANGASVVQGGTFGTANPVTVADLQATRRKMGPWGLNPADVTYVVNESVYYDLLEDPDFRTVDMVGAQATILRGQIGFVSGSPVIVSDGFATPAIDAVAAIALNTSNYLFGELRGLNLERDKDVLNQKNWLVSTRRFAFTPIEAAAANYASCTALLYPAS